MNTGMLHAACGMSQDQLDSITLSVLGACYQTYQTCYHHELRREWTTLRHAGYMQLP